MDGRFISTDIRYRDLIKSRRRSTSYSKAKSPGGVNLRSKSADVSGGGAIGSIAEEVAVVGGADISNGGANLLDEVFEDASDGLNVELNEGVDSNLTNSVPDVPNVESGEISSVEGSGGAVGGLEVPSVEVNASDRVDGSVGIVGGAEVPLLGEKEKGGENNRGEVPCKDKGGEEATEVPDNGGRENIGADNIGVGDIYGMGDCTGVGSGVGGCGGSSGGYEGIVEPVHHVPRWKLREILAHAEGECILCVLLLLLCAYR